MKSLGITRCVDQLGRIVLPSELREVLKIQNKDALEFFVDDNGLIILQRYNPGCALCDSMEDIINFSGKKICRKCLENIIKE